MKILALVMAGAALSLAGCADPVKDAERELEIVESSGGSSADICAAKRKVADAYLKAQDAKAYEAARLRADVQCMNAEFDRRFGPAPK